MRLVGGYAWRLAVGDFIHICVRVFRSEYDVMMCSNRGTFARERERESCDVVYWDHCSYGSDVAAFRRHPIDGGIVRHSSIGMTILRM